jgi:DNA-binding transcriptional LysR family regulator
MNDWAEFRHFKYLLAIAEHKGFRAAAEYLHTAQPNLSAQAKQFQDLSDVHLFRKGKDGRIRLTPTGVAFKSIAQGLLDARDEAIAALIAIERGEIRALKFGCTPSVDRALFHMACSLHKELVPDCPVRAAHGDTAQLVEELISGEIDVAIVTLPLSDLRLRIEEIRKDRLVVCLRKDNPLTAKATLAPADLQENLTILYHPQRHPGAHERLLELLAEAGLTINEYSRASHPTEMQELVKQGYGFALIREGTVLDPDLVTRPIMGVDWTVDTAIVCNKLHHPKTVPILLRQLKRRLSASTSKGTLHEVMPLPHAAKGAVKRTPRSDGTEPEQMSLLG